MNLNCGEAALKIRRLIADTSSLLFSLFTKMWKRYGLTAISKLGNTALPPLYAALSAAPSAASIIFSINIPYPRVGSLTNT